jgi:DNA-binding Lrp family transcriptional regulator
VYSLWEERVKVVSAYIMIKTRLGMQSDAYTKILKIKGVKFANTVTGPYDLIVFIESSDLNTLGKAVISKIQNLKCIKDTMTSIVIGPI